MEATTVCHIICRFTSRSASVGVCPTIFDQVFDSCDPIIHGSNMKWCEASISDSRNTEESTVEELQNWNAFSDASGMQWSPTIDISDSAICILKQDRNGKIRNHQHMQDAERFDLANLSRQLQVCKATC